VESSEPEPKRAPINAMSPFWRSPLKGRPVFIAIIFVTLLRSVDDPDKPKSSRLLGAAKRPIEQFSEVAPFIGTKTMLNRKNRQGLRTPSFGERSEVSLETLLPIMKGRG
jgi:hypothetical protein